MLDVCYPVVQIAYFVDNIESSAIAANRRYGAGPFFIAKEIPLEWVVHRGKEAELVHSSAYGQWGNVMLELVQQDSLGPSPFRDLYEEGFFGLHHIAMMVPSMQQAYQHFEEQQLEIATRAKTSSGVEFAFVDTLSSLGHFLEIYQESEQLLGFYRMVAQASENWQGQEVLRYLNR
jgi:hypothetical protein